MDGYPGLMERLAFALGIDLADLLKMHNISADTLERMALHCSFCDEQENCAQRIRHGFRSWAEPPEYCVNRKLLLYLQHIPHSELPDPSAPPNSEDGGDCVQTKSS